MILKIDFDERNVIYRGKGRILLKIKYYSQFGEGPHLVTTDGETKEDFDKAKPKKAKKVFIGLNGGISFF